MSVERTRRVAEEFITRLKKGDMESLVELYTEDQVINMLGETPVSGRHVGRDTFWPFALGEVVGRLTGSDEVYIKEHRLACVQDGTAVMLVHGGLPTKSGGRYDQNYGFVWTIRDGKICHTHELLDPDMIETAIYERRHATPRTTPPNPYRVDLGSPSRQASGTREDNVAVAEKLVQALRSPNDRAYVSLLHKDVVCNIVGSTPYSGRWIGRDALLSLPFDWHADHFMPNSRRIAQAYRLLCADDHGFCVLLTGNGVTKAGHEYNQHYGVLANVHEGLISDLHIFLDTAKAEELLFDNPFLTPARARAQVPFGLD